MVIETPPKALRHARRHVVALGHRFRPARPDRGLCGNPIDYRVEPAGAWKVVVLNCWKKLCPLCFDQLAEIARVKYSFVDVEATSWSGPAGAAATPAKAVIVALATR